MKIKILYVVSNLVSSGPTNQLLNIIRNLDSEVFQVIVITLSPESDGSMKYKFDEQGVEVQTLGLSRIQGLFKSKMLLKKRINEIAPWIIQTQGIRADVLLSKLQLEIPWIMTSRNYPFDDYPMKFGALKGKLMAHSHIAAIKKCSNVVACSKTIANLLGKHNIDAKPIQNGVHIEGRPVIKQSAGLPDFESPVFISVGSLIPRKNMGFLIEAFNLYSRDNKGSLVILGGGPEQSTLETKAQSENIHIMGSVTNVREYLSVSDYFVSASLSEGLPNTVLEGLALGLPVLLSDISSHEEIEEESSECSKIFVLDKGVDKLFDMMTSVDRIFAKDASISAENLAQTVFSAESMSKKYQALYQALLN
jgi:glycosyltransferase involved in cell wall biosynthesis